MKKVLLFLTMLAIAGIGTKLKAQCTGSNLNVIIKTVTSTPGGCQITMDISFIGDFNNGNKYAFIHLWESAPVNNYPVLNYNNPPTAAQLATAVGTVVIKDPGKSSAALYNGYPPNTSVPVLFAGINFTKSGSLYTMTNVVINLSTCDQPVTLMGDIWSSQSDEAQVVHCFNTGSITLLLNTPVITGFKQCATPRLLNLSFFNGHATINESVVVEVYIDVNSSGNIDAGDIDITGSLSPALPNPINLAANSTQSFNGMAYPPYSTQAMYDNMPIIVRANATAPGAASVTSTKNNINFLGSCALLPVSLKSFTATRSHSTVELKWETVFEQNNSGFAIERSSSGSWKTLAFVPSQAASGNSSRMLSYQYADMNTNPGITQYRIRQVDIDSKSTYSEVRSVVGEGQMANTVVYPNPTSNGKVNIVFAETEDVRDVSLVDISGKVIRQWIGISNTSLQVDNLAPGMYSLRTVIRGTGMQTVNKIMVNGR